MYKCPFIRNTFLCKIYPADVFSRFLFHRFSVATGNPPNMSCVIELLLFDVLACQRYDNQPHSNPPLYGSLNLSCLLSELTPNPPTFTQSQSHNRAQSAHKSNHNLLRPAQRSSCVCLCVFYASWRVHVRGYVCLPVVSAKHFAFDCVG